jgi:DNA-binding MarR family transcriptional regulator
MSSTALINVTESALRAFNEFTEDNDVQVLAVRLFLYIASHDGGDTDYGTLAKMFKTTQPAISRNIKTLTIGKEKSEAKYGLIHVEVNYADARRRILKLSSRGHELVKAIEASMLPGLLRYVTKEGVRA